MLSVMRMEVERTGHRDRPRGRTTLRFSAGGDNGWESIEEGIVREVISRLPRADARRVRLVCRAWRASLAGLSTSASTPAGATTVTRWRMQLDSMALSLPCLRELTVSSRLSDVAGQQLAALAALPQLRCLRVPQAHGLRDRSVQAIAALTQLRELHIHGAAALTGRALCALSMLGAGLEVLDLRGCGRLSWAELRSAWVAACSAYAAAAAASRRATRSGSGRSGSGSGSGGGRSGGSGGGGSGGGGGGWLLQDLLPGGADVLQACARAGRPLCISNARGRLRLSSASGRYSNGGAYCSPNCSDSGNSNSSGSSSGGGCSGGVANTARRGTRVRQSSHCGGNGVRIARLERLKSGQKSRGGSSSGGGGGSNGSGGGGLRRTRSRERSSGGGGAGDDDSGEGAGAANAAAEPGPGSSSITRQPRAAALRANAAAPRKLTGGGELSVGSGRAVFGGIFKNPAHAAAAGAAAATAVGTHAPQRPILAAASAGAYSGGALSSRQAESVAALYATACRVAHAPALAPTTPLAGGVSAGLTKQRSTVQAALLSLIAAEQRSSPPSRRKSSSLGGGRGRGRRRSGSISGGGALALPMPFPRLRSLSISLGDVGATAGGGGGSRMGAGSSLTSGNGFGSSAAAAELAAIAAITGLTSLEILRCQQVTDGALASLSALKKLSALRLLGLWSAGDKGLEAVANLTTLTSLALQAPMRASARGIGALSRLRSLEALSLSLPHALGAGEVASLARALPRLRALEAGCPDWCDADCAALALDAQKRAALTSLRLHDAPAVTPAGAAALRALPALATLSLDGCGGVPAGAMLGSGALPPQLRTLALRGQPFATLFAGGVVQRPACGGELASLDLSACADLTDRELRKLAAFFPALRDLNVAGCAAVTDAGLAALAPLTALRALSAGGTRATGAFAEVEGSEVGGGGGGGAPAVAAASDGNSSSSSSSSSDNDGMLPPATTSAAAHPAVAFAALATLSLRGCAALSEPLVRGALPRLGALESLDLSECRSVEDRTVLALACSLPNLGLLNVAGCRGVTRGVLPFVPHWLRLVHSLA